jgi:hypothetical protein
VIILNVLNEFPVSSATRIIISVGWRNKKKETEHSMVSEIMIVTRIIPRIIHFEVRILFRHRLRIYTTTKAFLFSIAIIIVSF